jgi:hypothetical protein
MTMYGNTIPMRVISSKPGRTDAGVFGQKVKEPTKQSSVFYGRADAGLGMQILE